MNNKIFKIILGILYYILEFVFIWGQKTEVIDCTNKELVTSIFNDPIDLNLRGIIKIYENVTINEILNTTNNEFELNYIDARLETSLSNGTKNLVLFTTEKFKNYAKEQTAARISFKINLGCGMGRERVVIFFQPLKECNYFSPTFSQSRYELIIPTPIFAGFDLTEFLEITAKDDDLTHNQINFTSDDSSKYYISVGTKNATSVDKKTSFASMRLNKILLELLQPIEFEIKATDNGDPSKSSTASIIIRSDPEQRLPPQPRFIQSLYKGLINFDFTMQPIEVQLVNGSYTREIIFSLLGVNAKDFYLHDHKNGLINIILNPENLNRSEILKHAKWELELRAEHVNLAEIGRANVLVELTDFQKFFRFINSYHEGDIDEMGELHIAPIIFNPYTYQTDMKFSLKTTKNFFHLSIQKYKVQLQLSNNFTWQTLEDIGFLKLTLEASWESLSSTTIIIIKLPQIKDKDKPQMFQFEKPLYVGQLNEKYDLELETIVLKIDDNSKEQNIVYSLKGNGSIEFYISISSPNQIQIKRNFNTSALLNEYYNYSSYFLVLEAKTDHRKTSTILVINKFQSHKSRIKKIFPSSLAMGKIFLANATHTQNLIADIIHVHNDVKENFEKLKFNITGDFALNFDFRINLTFHTIDLVLKMPLPINILNTKRFVQLTLHGFLSEPEILNDTLAIFIEMPIKECPEPVSSSHPDPPQFSSSNYIFTVYTNQSGLLGVVQAFSKSRNSTFHYTLEVKNDILAQRLSISPFGGELFLYGTIDEGNYLFNIMAENVETHERAHTKALLRVQQKEECKLYNGIAVEKTLMVVHVDEEKPYYGLVDLKFNENCTFYIEDMWPHDKEYVHINYIFNILDAIAIDREDSIFENMSDPQITVKLRLRCKKDDSQNFLTIKVPKPESRGPELLLLDDIHYAPDIMWLHIKIDDINDNSPEFKVSDDPLYLGYPSGDITLDIYPEYLTQIEAVDRDIGFNAKIKFTMRDNPYFDIEPETGKIYPKRMILEEDKQTELIVLATDQYGKGLISVTVVIVNALTPDFYSLITLKEKSAKSQKEVEELLSQETGYDIKVIKMSYVPQIIQQRLSENQSLSCKAWIYAYNRHQLVQHKELQEQILVKNPDTNIINIESYKQAAYHSSEPNDSQFGYLITTILLSLLCSSTLIFIIWRFCYKPTLNTNSDRNTLTQAANGNKNGNANQIPSSYSHGSFSDEDCMECNDHNDNRIKFSDLVENVTVEESHSK